MFLYNNSSADEMDDSMPELESVTSSEDESESLSYPSDTEVSGSEYFLCSEEPVDEELDCVLLAFKWFMVKYPSSDCDYNDSDESSDGGEILRGVGELLCLPPVRAHGSFAPRMGDVHANNAERTCSNALPKL